MNALNNQPRRRPASRLLLLAAFVTWLSGSASAAGTAPIADGVLVDEARGITYLMNLRGGLDAIDAASGAVLWSSSAATKPLLLEAGTLIAQAEPKSAGKIELVALDTSAAGALMAKGESPLPADLHATVTNTLRGRFRSRAFADGGKVLVAWESVLFPGRFDHDQLAAEGNAPRRAGAASPREGAVQFDFRTGETTIVPLGQIRGIARTQASAWLEVHRDANGDRSFTSPAANHQLTSRRIEGDKRRFEWTISERSTGRVLGRVESHLAMAPFEVAGGRLLVVVPPWAERVGAEIEQHPLKLVAFDLASGREAWTAAMRDTTYRGPFPP